MPTYRIFRPPHVLSQPLGEFLGSEAGRDFTSLTALLPSNWKALVMGGLLRDSLIRQMLKVESARADVDMVITGAGSIDEIKQALGSVICSTNAFGGFKCRMRAHGVVFDLWRIEDHTNMSLSPKPPSVEQLLRHNLLDIDALVWDASNDFLHDCGAINAVQGQRIGLMGTEGISGEYLATQVAHVLVVAFKTSFTLSEEVCSFVAEASARCRSIDIEKAIERKLPKALVQIESFWNDLLSGGTQRCTDPTRTISL